MKINVGCGDCRAPEPWVNVDANPNDRVKPDVIADARSLPYDDASVSEIFCGHLLEHLPEAEVTAALREFRRVLEPDGGLCVVGPDYDRALPDGDPVLLSAIRYGGGRWSGDEHLWLSTATRTLELVREVFPEATEVPIKELDHFWPLTSAVWWQFAIVY